MRKINTKALLISLGYIFVVVIIYFFLIWLLLPSYQKANPLDNQVRGIPLFAIEVILITIPYLAGGGFLGLLGVSRSRYVLGLPLLTTISERLLVLFLALNVLRGFRQFNETGAVFYTEGTADVLVAIQTEALPYFNLFYIFAGILISVLVSYSTAKFIYLLRKAVINARGS